MDEITESLWDPAETTVFQEPPPAVAAARASLASTGVHLMPAATVSCPLRHRKGGMGALRQSLGESFPGPVRLRTRHLSAAPLRKVLAHPPTGELTQLPDTPFVQPDRSNPLYVDVDRHFDPLTDAFVAKPLLRSVVTLLGHVAGALDSAACWIAKVHPFRVVATADDEGQPRPRRSDAGLLVAGRPQQCDRRPEHRLRSGRARTALGHSGRTRESAPVGRSPHLARRVTHPSSGSVPARAPGRAGHHARAGLTVTPPMALLVGQMSAA